MSALLTREEYEASITPWPTWPWWAVATETLGEGVWVFYSKETQVRVKLVLGANKYRYETVTVRAEEWHQDGYVQGPFIATINSVDDLEQGYLPADAIRVQRAISKTLEHLGLQEVEA